MSPNPITDPVALLVALAAAAFFLVLLPVFVSGFLRFRRRISLPCPEARSSAAVQVSPLSGALSEFRSRPRLRVLSCSLWPERAGCKQACLLDLERAC